MSCVVLTYNLHSLTESRGAGAGIQLARTCFNGNNNYNPAPGETLPFVKDIPVSTKAAWKDIRHSNIEYTQVVTKHKGLYIVVATLETKYPKESSPLSLHSMFWGVKAFCCWIWQTFIQKTLMWMKLSPEYFWVYLTLNHSKHPGIHSDWDYFPRELSVTRIVSTLSMMFESHATSADLLPAL